MDDLIKAMKAQLYDRASSPLVFSFVCAWAAWNYRLILLLLSGLPATDKFMQIEMLPLAISPVSIGPYAISPWLIYWGSYGLVGPLVTTLFYLLVLPRFEAMAFGLTQAKAVELKIIKLKAEGATPISDEEARALRQTVRETEKRHDEALQAQKALLTQAITELQASLDGAKYEHAGEGARLKAEVSELTAERDEALQRGRDLQSALDIALANRTQLLLLTPPAVDLFSYIGKRRHQHVLISELATEQKVLAESLAGAGLVDIHSGMVELTADGQYIYMDALFPKKE